MSCIRSQFFSSPAAIPSTHAEAIGQTWPAPITPTARRRRSASTPQAGEIFHKISGVGNAFGGIGHPGGDLAGSGSERPPLQPHAPTPSSTNATAVSSSAAADSRPWSRLPARSWSLSGTCSPIQQPASATSDPTTTCIHTERKLRNHIAQLTAMGYRVTLEPLA
jgi:hypothetical protein